MNVPNLYSLDSEGEEEHTESVDPVLEVGPPAFRAGSNRFLGGPGFVLALAKMRRLAVQIQAVETDDLREEGHFEVGREGHETERALLAQRGVKSSFEFVLIRTTRRWIQASASTNQGPEKGDLVRTERAVGVQGGQDRAEDQEDCRLLPLAAHRLPSATKSGLKFEPFLVWQRQICLCWPGNRDPGFVDLVLF